MKTSPLRNSVIGGLRPEPDRSLVREAEAPQHGRGHRNRARLAVIEPLQKDDAFLGDVAFLPINGNRPERRVAGNLDGREAAELAHRVNARLIIPCHYGMFEFNTAPPDLFVSTCRNLGQPHYVMRTGERLSLPAR